jgi:hypothetical protein
MIWILIPAVLVVGAIAFAATRRARSTRNRATTSLLSFQSVDLNRVDPFSIGDPWRRHAQGALAARRRLREVVASTATGPIKERLGDIAHDVDRAVATIWEIAQQGHLLSKADRKIGDTGSATKLAALEVQLPNASDAEADRLRRLVDSLRTTTETSSRLQQRRTQAAEQLREMDARLDELVAGATEIATLGVESDSVDTLRVEMDSLTVDLEGLRQGLEETRRTATA